MTQIIKQSPSHSVGSIDPLRQTNIFAGKIQVVTLTVCVLSSTNQGGGLLLIRGFRCRPTCESVSAEAVEEASCVPKQSPLSLHLAHSRTMTARKEKFTRVQKDALKRARYEKEEYLRFLEDSCLDYQKVIPDQVYEDAERENALGNPYPKRKLERMREVSKYKDEIGPLAKQGLYRYDMSEQFDDGDQTPITVESPR